MPARHYACRYHVRLGGAPLNVTELPPVTNATARLTKCRANLKKNKPEAGKPAWLVNVTRDMPTERPQARGHNSTATTTTATTKSAFNVFMKVQLAKLKAEQPDLRHNERFKIIARRWKAALENPQSAKPLTAMAAKLKKEAKLARISRALEYLHNRSGNNSALRKLLNPTKALRNTALKGDDKA